jgi:hypothetical protein
MHKFVLMVEGNLVTYENYESIPYNFDHLIEFVPEIPDGPHSSEQHEEIEKWNHRLQELIARENKKHGNS